MKRVSVVMTVYRPQPELFRIALRSILEQRFDDFELIIVEDPSDVSAESVIREVCDSRIRYIANTSRTSLVKQKNIGIAESTSPLIAMMDCDDECHCDRLRLQVEAFEQNPDLSVLGSNIEIVDEFSNVIGARDYPSDHEGIARAMPSFVPICHPSVMIRRSVLLDAGGYADTKLPAQDYELWSRLLLAGYRFRNLASRLLRYRLHPLQIKATRTRDCIAGVVGVKQRLWLSRMCLPDRLRYYCERASMCLPESVLLFLIHRLTYGNRRKHASV